MAFVADCEVSTVLEALRVASKARFPIPEESWTPSEPLWGGRPACQPDGKAVNSKSEIRNPQFGTPPVPRKALLLLDTTGILQYSSAALAVDRSPTNQETSKWRRHLVL